MTRDGFVAAAIAKWATENAGWLRRHGLRDGPTILDIGAYMDLLAELECEALRLYHAARSPQLTSAEQTTFALEDIAA